MVSAAFAAPASVPLTRGAARATCSRRAVATMSLRRRVETAAAATVPAALVAAPALASEGTGEAFGVDNALLLIPFLLVPGIFLFLYLQFDRTQEKSDFFGGIDDRRN